MLICLLIGCFQKNSPTPPAPAPLPPTNPELPPPARRIQPDKSAKGGAQANDVVRIPLQDQQRAGIQTAYVLVQRTPRTLSVAGQVMMDEQHTSHLGTIADGRITAVNVLPGASVRRGQVLGSLHSHIGA